MKLNHEIKQPGTMKTLSNKFRSLIIAFFIANLVLMSNAFGQIAIRGTYTTGSNSSNNLTINKPTGVIAGDVMIVNISKYPNTTTPTLSGWTLIAGPATLGGSNYSYLLYRVADGTEGSGFTFALGTTTYGAGSIVAFSGVDVTGGFLVGGGAGGPFDVAPGSISTTGVSASSQSITAITTNSANAAVIMFGMNGSATARTFSTWSTAIPGTLTEIYDFNGATYIEVGAAWATKATTGSTGTSSLTLSGTSDVGGILIALKKFVCPTISATAGSNSPVCTGSTINLTTTNASGGTSPYTYSWTGPNSYISSLQNPAIANSTTGMGGTYIVTAKDSKGCTGTSNVVITVNTPPMASVNGQTNITCSGGSDGTITILSSAITGTYFYSVDNGLNYTSSASNPFVFPGLQANQSYKIRVKDSNGCQSKLVQ